MFATKSNLVDKMTDQTVQTFCHNLVYIMTLPIKGLKVVKILGHDWQQQDSNVCLYICYFGHVSTKR